MGIITDPARELESKVEVLRDLEGRVGELMESHERKRDLWYPSDLSGARARTPTPTSSSAKLRAQAKGIPDHARAALALNLLTEEGLPHFHRLLAVYLGDESHWRTWNNLWTAEEDRHGQVLHDYARDTRLFDQRKIEEMQFEYLRRGLPSRLGPRSRTASSPTPRCRSAPPSSRTPRPARSSASTSPGWARS